MQPSYILFAIFVIMGFEVVWTRIAPTAAPTSAPTSSAAQSARNFTSPCSIDVHQLCPEVEAGASNYYIEIGSHLFNESRELRGQLCMHFPGSLQLSHRAFVKLQQYMWVHSLATKNNVCDVVHVSLVELNNAHN